MCCVADEHLWFGNISVLEEASPLGAGEEEDGRHQVVAWKTSNGLCPTGIASCAESQLMATVLPAISCLSSGLTLMADVSVALLFRDYAQDHWGLVSNFNLFSQMYKRSFNFFFSSTGLLLPTHLPPLSSTHAQSCKPMDFSPPDSSVHGFFQARILEWVAISFSNLLTFIILWTCCLRVFQTGAVPSAPLHSSLPGKIIFKILWSQWKRNRETEAG